MKEYLAQSLHVHRRLVDEFASSQGDLLERIACSIADCFRQERTLLLCGNGGSAADCQHIAGEFVGRFRRERRALPAIALTTDSSVMTCLGNDYSYDLVFQRRVEGLARPGDVLWAFSTSGASVNIINAAQAARQRQATVIAFAGRPGSRLEQLADLCLCVDCEVTSAIQEIHQLAYHLVCGAVEDAIVEQQRA